MKKYWPLLLIVLLTGCRTKKEVIKTEVRTSDSLFVKTETIKAPVLNQSLTIEQICDTITGEVVRFKKVFVVDGDSIQILTDVNNSLQIKISQRERTISEKDSIIQKLRSDITSISETVIYKKNWNWIFGAFTFGLVIGVLRPWKYLWK